MISRLVCWITSHKWGSWSDKISAKGLTCETHGLPNIELKVCTKCGVTYYRPVR